MYDSIAMRVRLQVSVKKIVEIREGPGEHFDEKTLPPPSAIVSLYCCSTHRSIESAYNATVPTVYKRLAEAVSNFR